MAQVARNQTDAIDGKLNGMKYIIHDRDPLFQGRFTGYLYWTSKLIAVFAA